MIAIGFDPGTARLGYGVIESEPDPRAIDFGVIVTDAALPMAQRLLVIHEAVGTLIDRFRPTSVAVELLFFARNVTTAMTVGQARGVILLTAAERGIPVSEYTPSEVKQAVVGYGKADKRQIQEMVRIMLGLSTAPQPDDAADALAVAICHVQVAPFRARVEA
ncbi:MAG: crossover junction endodeoxyribonuclease RuvC [Chloroflexota bacterium]|nr:crossover junction endodeoxyribonuclease RuvC [Chloroflexia bacterium]MDQ3226522.1 crossover junction endodeoxyribonuclease RuvC [Chloroflexota bacterium]